MRSNGSNVKRKATTTTNNDNNVLDLSASTTKKFKNYFFKLEPPLVSLAWINIVQRLYVKKSHF